MREPCFGSFVNNERVPAIAYTGPGIKILVRPIHAIIDPWRVGPRLVAQGEVESQYSLGCKSPTRESTLRSQKHILSQVSTALALACTLFFSCGAEVILASVTTSIEVKWSGEPGEIVEIQQRIEALETSSHNRQLNVRFGIHSQTTNLNLHSGESQFYVFIRQIADFQVLSRDTSCRNIVVSGPAQWLCTAPISAFRQNISVRVRRETDPLWWEYSVRSQTGDLMFGLRFAFTQVTAIDPASLVNRIIASGDKCDDGNSFSPGTTRFGYPLVRYSDGRETQISQASFAAMTGFECGLLSRHVLNYGPGSATVHFGNSTIATSTTTTTTTTTSTTTTTVSPVSTTNPRNRQNTTIGCVKGRQKLQVTGRRPVCPAGFHRST